MKSQRILILLCVSVAIGLSSAPGTLCAQTFTGPELLSRPTANSVTVSAVVNQALSVRVRYGTAAGPANLTNLTDAVSATANVPVKVVIGGLSPNMKYYYQLGYSTGGSWTWRTEHGFYTQRAQGSTYKFTITSDTHLGDTFSGNTAARYQDTMENVAADSPDFHLDLGDAFIMSGTTTQATVNTKYLNQRPYFGNFSHSAHVFLAIGNHENEEGWNLDDTPFSQGLASIIARKSYFPNPIPDGFYTGNSNLLPAIGGDQYREDYYSWNWGDALFIVLDPFQYTMTKPYGTVTGSGEDVPEDETVSGDQWNWTLGQTQFNWLKQTLQSSNAKYKFVFAHHVVGGELTVSNSAAGPPTYVRGGAMAAPYFEWGGQNSSGTPVFATQRPGWGTDPIHQLMIANGVSAFFHGHDHQFVHELRDGIVYQLVPAAGMTGNGFDLYAGSPYVVSGGNLQNAGHLRVTVAPSAATVAYYRMDTGTVVHSYTIAPHLFGDFGTSDCDVDGSDLAALIPNSAIYDVSKFAQNFGKTYCQ
jgi:hypothetical protein